MWALGLVVSFKSAYSVVLPDFVLTVDSFPALLHLPNYAPLLGGDWDYPDNTIGVLRMSSVTACASACNYSKYN
jgi:hypothetical protein